MMNAESRATMALNSQDQAHQEQEKLPMMTLEEVPNWKQESILWGPGHSTEISYQLGKQFHYQDRRTSGSSQPTPGALLSVATAWDVHQRTAAYCAARGKSQLDMGTLSRKWAKMWGLWLRHARMGFVCAVGVCGQHVVSHCCGLALSLSEL